ncbi:MAG: hypothetical protein AB8B87_08945 [Granulosicoccus sp.]
MSLVIALLASLGLAACSESDDPAGETTPEETVDTVPVNTDPAEETTSEETVDTVPVNTDPTVAWSEEFPGSVPARSELIGTDDIALVRSTELDNFQWLTAVVPDTGQVLWRQSFMNNQCGPAITEDGDVVAQLNADFELAGEDSSDDIVLFDGTTGEILDQWQPGLGVLAPCASGSLLINDDGIIIHFERGLQKGFRITASNELELAWEKDDLEFFDTDEEVALIGNNLFLIQQFERSAGDGVDVVYVLRMDTNSGEILDTLETDMRRAESISATGPDHLLINGKDINDDDYSLLFTGVGSSSDPDDITIAWDRVFDDSGNGDGVTFGISAQVALSDGAFASWSRTGNTSTVSEFSLETGLANWSFQTSSFSNNDTIATLPAGGYAVAPFGGNFLEATDPDGELAWVLESVEGLGFPAGFRSLGDNKLLVTSPVTDGGWAITGIQLPDQ